MSRSCKKLTLVLIVVLAAGLLATAGVNAQGRSGEKVVIAAGEVVPDDLYVAATQLIVDGTVKGDIVGFARSITINGTVEGDLLAAAQTIVINGTINDDARIAGQALVLGKGGKIGDDVVVAGFSFEAQPDSIIGGDLLFGAGQALVAGDVAGNVSGGGGSLQIAGRVGGNVDVGVGDAGEAPPVPYAQFMPALPGGLAMPSLPRGLTISQGARIGGQLTYSGRSDVPIPGGAVTGKVTRRVPETTAEEAAAPAAFDWGAWSLDQGRRLIRLLVVGLLMIWLAPGWLRRVAASLRARPWGSLGWGALSPFALVALILIAVVAMVVIVALLSYIIGSATLITVLLGSVTGTVVLAYLLLACYVGALIAGYAVGELILGRGASGSGARSLWAMLIGVVIVWLLTLIPWVGTFIGVVLALFGLGAIWLALRRREPAAAPLPAEPAPAS